MKRKDPAFQMDQGWERSCPPALDPGLPADCERTEKYRSSASRAPLASQPSPYLTRVRVKWL